MFCLFERENVSSDCPFGGGVCGSGDTCPLHDRLARVRKATDEVLRHTTFEVFQVAYKKNRGKTKWRLSDTAKPPASYRPSSRS